MHEITLADNKVSSIILGTMRIAEKSNIEVLELLNTALENRINFIDTADIYGGGKCEELLGEAFTADSSLREKFTLQSKCGIRKDGAFTWYDFSKVHILEAVNSSLQRLKTDYLDVLLLHRPDALMEPEEIAEAFDILEGEGKVRHFGVSNMNPAMIELLKKNIRQPLIVNQLQLSAAFTPAIDSGFHMNMEDNAAIVRSSSILEYCRLNDIVIQTWSPLQYGYLQGTFIDDDKYLALNSILDRIAREKGCTKAAVALAWIKRYPAAIQTVIGTTNPEHIREASGAMNINISKHEWYEIYLAAGKNMP